ncbi:MAG: Unknown protein [uncultured Aureispira sp.]|uniref:Secretion system C-terminal sorting domain-containing protein n=1 Tax=uncultured Aureispira sp. TaxID=1331704 RepID=A0A6S6UD15_9BACT|nr:MAG: Unknown protein [uncultured Aureispira sp.]
MNLLTYRVFFILLLIGNQSIAQKKTINASYDFSCTAGLYQLRSNQLNVLSVNGRGEITWVPILPEFERPLSALAYCEEDGFMYSFDTATHELLRIYTSGAIQPLWVPVEEKSGVGLNAQLTKGALIEGVFCAYAPQEDSLYWVNIITGKFVKSYNPIGGAFTNLAYHPIKKMLYSIGVKSRIQYLDAETKDIAIGQKIVDLPEVHSSKGTNTWMTKDGRIFVTRNGGTYFAEINEAEGMRYRYQNVLPKTIGDGTSCSGAKAPAFIQSEVLELKLDAPKQDRIMLRWIGVHEHSTVRYILEHSTDHKEWTERAQKPSIGLNNYQNPYGARLPFQANQDNYYRLKKVYKDGNRVAYSPSVMRLKKPTEAKLVLSPKVLLAKAALSLYVNATKGEHLQVVVRNSYNAVVYKTTYQVLAKEVTFSLETESLTKGMYQVQIVSAVGVYQEWIWIQ